MFKEKVQSMTAKEIILAMVEGLRHPSIKVDMDTFGEQRYGVCYGCAATNTVCKISGITFDSTNIMYGNLRAEAINTDMNFLILFESAIDGLRAGSIDYYNKIALREGFAEIDPVVDIPALYGDYTEEDLEFFVELASLQV